MKIVLTDRSLCNINLPNDVDIRLFKPADIRNYDHSDEVVAIVGSRALSKVVANMDLPNLKLYQLTSAGYDGVPLSTFADKKVDVANAGGVYSIPIAETVVYGMLMTAKKLRTNPNDRRAKIRRHYTEITELAEKKVMMLGVGNIGTATANRLVGFEMAVDGYARTTKQAPPFGKIFRTRAELLENLSEYDFIISSLPDTDSTRGFIDSALLERMKETAVFINVGRRAVIDEDALYRALKKKQLGGAVLDMFEIIPHPLQNKFRRLKNTVVLPGVAAISQEVNERLARLIAENIHSVLNEEQIKYTIGGV